MNFYESIKKSSLKESNWLTYQNQIESILETAQNDLDNNRFEEFCEGIINLCQQYIGDLPNEFLDSDNIKLKESVNWNYFDKFQDIINKYMPDQGQGETKASQIVTAINKLIYKYYNDGDVYDTTNMSPGANDLSSYANWLATHTDARNILNKIFTLRWDDQDGYEDILRDLADKYLTEDVLSDYASQPAVESIYHCGGRFSWDINNWEEDY